MIIFSLISTSCRPVDYNPCRRAPCLNRGVCFNLPEGGWNGYTCECANGFIGARCDIQGKQKSELFHELLFLPTSFLTSIKPSSYFLQMRYELWCHMAVFAKNVTRSWAHFNCCKLFVATLWRKKCVTHLHSQEVWTRLYSGCRCIYAKNLLTERRSRWGLWYM